MLEVKFDMMQSFHRSSFDIYSRTRCSGVYVGISQERQRLEDPYEVAHDQMDAQGTPAVPFDASVDIINSSPFPRCDSLAILAGNTREAPMLVQLPAVGTLVRGVDETVRQLCGIKRPLCGRGRTDQCHDNRWPGERGALFLQGALLIFLSGDSMRASGRGVGLSMFFFLSV